MPRLCGSPVFRLYYAIMPMGLFGMLVSGVSCPVIGSGTFLFTHPKRAPGSPPGDHIPGPEEEIILLKGENALSL